MTTKRKGSGTTERKKRGSITKKMAEYKNSKCQSGHLLQTVDKPINGDNVQTFKLLMSKNIYLQNRDMNSFFARLIKLFRNSKTSCRTEKRLFRQAVASAKVDTCLLSLLLVLKLMDLCYE